MYDKNLTIEMNDIIQLKKISAALLMKKEGPLEMINQFFIDNYNNLLYYYKIILILFWKE